MLYPSNQERTLTLYPGLYHLAPGERNQVFIIYPGGADLTALSIKPRTGPNAPLRTFSSSPEERNQAFIIYTGGAILNCMDD